MNSETRPLLARLHSQIDEDKEFAEAIKNSGSRTPKEFRLECRQIVSDLYDTAAAQ